jgi:putative flavoprotein involved in K+ transport
VGRHVRLPRTYRGRDIMAWLDEAGILDQSIDAMADRERARRQPSFQLVGRPDRANVDLPALVAAGVRLVGRVTGVTGARVALAADLGETTRQADARLTRLLDGIDAFIAARGLDASPADRPRPFAAPAAPTVLDLAGEGIATVVWCTGYRRAYPWLRVPILDERGELLHDRGITAAPGLVVLGLQFMRRRKSSFLDGVGADAEELAAHLAA